MHWRVLMALALGVALGAALHAWWTPSVWQALGVRDAASYLGIKPTAANASAGGLAWLVRFVVQANDFVGRAFLLVLRFIAVPIVLFSIVGAVAGVRDMRMFGRVGGKTLAFFSITLCCALAIGLAVGLIFRPGSSVSPESQRALMEQFALQAKDRLSAAGPQSPPGLFAYLLSSIPTNPFKALAEGNMLQIIVASMLVGAGLSAIPKGTSEPVVRVVNGLNEAIMTIVRWVMALAPFAVFCLIAQMVATIGLGPLRSVLVYCLCVVGGLAAMLVVYAVLVFVVTPRGARVSFGAFFRGIAPATTVAFSSSSSSATLPVTMQCARDRLGVPADIAGFVCPLGTTINMDGTALYQIVSVLFLAQLWGVPLGAGALATVAFLSAVVAVGAPGIPGSSVVMMAAVLQAVGVSTEGIAIIIAVDRVLDMCRTIVNIAGDAAACVAVASSEGRLGVVPREREESGANRTRTGNP